MALALVKYLPVGTNIGFINLRTIGFIFSSLLMLASIGAFAAFGINFGIDFTGGVQTEVRTSASIAQVRVVAEGIDERARVQGAGVSDNRTIMLITLPLQEGEGIEGERAQNAARQALADALTATFSDPGMMEIRGSSVIGGAVSGELIFKGLMSIGVALVLMLIYIFIRFDQIAYSLGAVLALVHDVIATIGLFAVTQLKFDLATVAAILTIVGYSMNDTVVVYDRIRENLRKYKREALDAVLNRSMNDVMSRTILTSLTTLVALFALYLIGGTSLEGFSLAMIWGVLIGTYSSIFVAVPLLLALKIRRQSKDD